MLITIKLDNMAQKKSPTKVALDTSGVDKMTQDAFHKMFSTPPQSSRNEPDGSAYIKDNWDQIQSGDIQLPATNTTVQNDATAQQRLGGSEEEGLWGPLNEAQKARRAGRRERKQIKDESRAKKIKIKNIAKKEKVLSKVAEKEKGYVNNKNFKRGQQITNQRPLGWKPTIEEYPHLQNKLQKQKIANNVRTVAEAASAIMQTGFIKNNIKTDSKSSISSNNPNPWTQGYKQGNTELENLQHEVNKLKGAPKALGSPAKIAGALISPHFRTRFNAAASINEGNMTNTADPYKEINPALNTRNQVGAIENLPPSGPMGITFGETVGQSSYNSGTPDIMGTGGPRSSIRMEGAFANPYFNNSPNAPRGGQRRANQMFGSARSRQVCMNLGKIKK